MNTVLKNSRKPDDKASVLLFAPSPDTLPGGFLTKPEKDYIKNKLDSQKDLNFFHFNKLSKYFIVCLAPEKKEDEEYAAREKIRRLGSKTADLCKNEQIEKLSVVSADVAIEDVGDFLEGLLLGSYTFHKYKTGDKKKQLPASVSLTGVKPERKAMQELEQLVKSVFRTRDWINEPGSTLLPGLFAEQVSEMFSGLPSVKTEVLTGKKIAALKMAGIEAVSKGGPNQPAFIVLEYLPKHLLEQNPYVIIGKGIFFDTGGINLKPGPALADMKCDMSGAAVVASVIHMVATLKLDVPVVGLIPATENRPGLTAYLPGDVLTMMNGITVEIKNTDAEGRLILADALCYAAKYHPSLVMTIATLTGSAHATFGQHAIAGMQSQSDFYFSMLRSAGLQVYERIAELPMWEEYEQMIESQVADIQNVGGKYAGAITAAKFLCKFTDAPFIHLDIAGPAFYEKTDGYIPAGGTGQGVRLLVEFFSKLSKLQKSNEP